MRASIRNVLPLLLLFAFGPPLAAQTPDPLDEIWFVGEYDPARDPAADLEGAKTEAQGQGKRILLEIGGEWCGWCHRLDLFIREHPAIAQGLLQGFLVVKVNMSGENRNEAFLSRYPRIPGYPHIFVLDSDGTLLHSQDTVELEEGSTYNEGAILVFIRRWAPGSPSSSSG